MRALTLIQPWAGLVASGIKLVENRTRSMVKREDFGKPFAVHAGAKYDGDVIERVRSIAPEIFGCDSGMTDAEILDWTPTWRRMGDVSMAVLGVATIERAIVERDGRLVDMHDGSAVELEPDQRRWFFGPVGYVLRDVHALSRPISCPGARGFWTLPPAIEASVLESAEA